MASTMDQLLRRSSKNLPTTALALTLALCWSHSFVGVEGRPTSTCSSRDATCQNNGPWKLPSPPFNSRPSSRSFLDECESLLSFVERLRAGAASGYEGDFDDRQRYSQGRDNRYDDEYRRQYSTGRRQGRYPEDDDRDAFYEKRGDDDHYYDDYDDDRPRPRWESSPQSTFPSAPAFLSRLSYIVKEGDRQIGLTLLGAGSLITVLGMSLFFNKTLLRLGNILLIAGVPVFVGPRRTAGYFLQPQKARATSCLALGILLVLWGRPTFGIILEVFGLLNLFGNMFPVLLVIAKQMPILGNILNSNNNNQQNPNSGWSAFTSTPASSNSASPPQGGRRWDDDGRYPRNERQYYEDEDDYEYRSRGPDDVYYGRDPADEDPDDPDRSSYSQGRG